MKVQLCTRTSAAIMLTAFLALTSVAQIGSPGQRATSPEVDTAGRVTFRILAPQAQGVRLGTPDIPDSGQGVTMKPATNGTFTVLEAAMTRTTNGLWEVNLGSIAPGAYRYNFNVDGVMVTDPLNPATSESNDRTWSLAYIPGADFMALRDVPHGAVAVVAYHSKSLQRFRRMHVYTPPGYENGKGRFPVLYLLHGMGDCDASWASVGRAGFIMDNLIAAQKAKPMIVVMPAGHTGSTEASLRTQGLAGLGDDEFIKDFQEDIMPYVEHHYRVRADRQDRAIAGLSMGGRQALEIGIPHLDQFAYLGVFSSGAYRLADPGSKVVVLYNPAFEEQNQTSLDNPKLKQGLKRVWFATGRDDFLLDTSRATVAMFKQHNFNVVFEETSGAHSWINWRMYLNAFAPQLFQ
jgi:enterochelin esterase family protein